MRARALHTRVSLGLSPKGVPGGCQHVTATPIPSRGARVQRVIPVVVSLVQHGPYAKHASVTPFTVTGSHWARTTRTTHLLPMHNDDVRARALVCASHMLGVCALCFCWCTLEINTCAQFQADSSTCNEHTAYVWVPDFSESI